MKKLLAILLSLAFILSARAAIPPAENLLPADTLLVVSVPDCAGLRAAARLSPIWLFWNDPAMEPLRKKFMVKFNESFVSSLEKDLGAKLADFEDLPQGQFTLAITQNGWTGGDDTRLPGVLLLLDAGDKSDLLKTNLAALLKKWTESGKPIHTEDIRGIPFSILPLSSGTDLPAALSGLVPGLQLGQGTGAQPNPDSARQLVIGQFESLLIAGNSVEAVEPVVAHLTGSEMPALVDNAQFAADKLAQLRNAPLCYGWLNAENVFNSLARMSSSAPDAPSLRGYVTTPLGKIIAASGLTGVKSVCFAYCQTPDGTQANMLHRRAAIGPEGIDGNISPRRTRAPARQRSCPPTRWNSGAGGWTRRTVGPRCRKCSSKSHPSLCPP